MFYFFMAFIFLIFAISLIAAGAIIKKDGENYEKNRVFTEGVISGKGRGGTIDVRFPEGGD